jgi:hypothetical protein
MAEMKQEVSELEPCPMNLELGANIIVEMKKEAPLSDHEPLMIHHIQDAHGNVSIPVQQFVHQMDEHREVRSWDECMNRWNRWCV